MNKVIKSCSFFFGFFIFSFLELTPLYLLHINLDNLSITVKTIYLLCSSTVFLGIVLIAYHKDMIAYFKDFKVNGKKYLGKCINYWLIGLIVMVITNRIISIVGPNTLPENEEMVRSLLNAAPLYMIISTVIFAPLTEEIICRKTFKDIIENKWLFIAISSFAFGAAHVVGSLTSAWDLLYIIPYGALGWAFAYSYYKTNNLFTSISLHAIHNGLLVLLYLLAITK